MAGLLNIGLSGVNAAQGQLITTSHNITNAGTDGYHRQRVIQATQTPYFSGVGFFGTGTKMAAVTRAYDQFLENQVLSTDTRRAEYATYAAQIRQIDNMLADTTSGLSPAMDAFFAGLRDVAADPTSLPSRQSLLSSAQSLVGRFHSLDERLTEIREGVEYDIRATVEQINTLASDIAELNQRIVVAQAAGSNKPANDLLDQRWELVNRLNQLIQVTTKEQSDGSLSVSICSGQSLVESNQATKLGAVQDANDPQRYCVAIIPKAAPNTPIRIPERLMNGGGVLAGLLAFRRESLDSTQNRLGMIAVSVASAINNQQKLGVDLGGELGLDIFSLPDIHLMPSGAATVKFDFDTNAASDDIANLGLLTDADYELKYDGANYTITNLSTKVSHTLTGTTDTFEGLSIDLTGTTLTNAGDSALIQPSRYMARGIDVAITDPRKIAASCPVIANAPIANTGTGKVSDIKINNVGGTATPLPGNLGVALASLALAFEYNAGNLTITSSTPAGLTIAPTTFNPATDATGKTFTVTDPASGFEFTLTFSGTPVNGDTFSLQPTEAGVADNRNANLLVALQTAKLLFNSTTGEPTGTMDSAYSQLVNKVGNKTHEVQTNESTQTTLYGQACEARDALSAVNLDEEAANLIRYQQAYQASARVMTIAQTLFDEIISIVR